MVQATVSPLYPNRIALSLGTLIGPLTSPSLGAFTPGRDLEIYVDGLPLPIQSSSFDVQNNRYLIFAAQAFDVSGLVQVVHHMPLSPFAPALVLGGFGDGFGYDFVNTA